MGDANYCPLAFVCGKQYDVRKAWGIVAMSVRISIDSRGRLLIPAEVRKRLGFNEGDSVLVEPVGPGEFKVLLVKDSVERARGMYSHLRDSAGNVSDELISDRRREAKKEVDGSE